MGKMIAPTSTTEFARVELLKKRLAEGFPGVVQDMIDRALESAKSLLEMEMKASVEKFMSKYGSEDWYKCARAMYTIEEENYQWRVISNTRDWENNPEWIFGSKWEAEAKINQLIFWLQQDLKRGRAQAEKHIERGTKILESKMAVA